LPFVQEFFAVAKNRYCPELRFKTMLKKLQNGESGMAADILEEVYA